MNLHKVSIRFLLLGVGCASLLVPVVAVLSLRMFDVKLVRETETELHAQGALIAAAYQGAWAAQHGKAPGNPRAPYEKDHSFVLHRPLISDLDQLAANLPKEPPMRSSAMAPEDAALSSALSDMLRTAQIFNLSGVRVLDMHGCAIASSRAQLDRCFHHQPEVRTALHGQPSAALRERVTDEPTPPLGSFRRRGDLRVFVGVPVFDDGRQIGVVLLSRTAESGLEWLFKNRRGIFVRGFVVVLLTALITLFFSWLITRPLSRMARVLREATEGPRDPSAPPARLANIPAPLEVHMLGAALDERAERLEEKSRYVTEFASNVTHELKTPLTSIRGAVELLIDQFDEMNDEQRRRFLLNIDAAAERTNRLVARLLTLAQVEAGNVGAQPHQVAVCEWARDFCSAYGHDVQLTCNLPDERQLARADLESVVGNLLENALRYRRSAPIQLRISAGPAPAADRPQRTQTLRLKPLRGDAASRTQLSDDAREHVLIEVEDDGPGISQENQPRLFQRFFTTERDRGGTGLGLAIVAAIAKGRGGHCDVESSARGTRFRVWL